MREEGGAQELSRVLSPERLRSLAVRTPAFGFTAAWAATQDVAQPPWNGTALPGSVANATLAAFPEEWCEGCAGPSELERGMFARGEGEGAVALFEMRYGQSCFVCGYELLAQMSRDAGASALLFYSFVVPGHEVLVAQSWARWRASRDQGLLAFEVGADEGDELGSALLAGEEVRLDIVPSPNPFVDYALWEAFNYFLCALVAVALAVGCARWLQFFALWARSGRLYKTPMIIIGLENFANLVRLFYLAVDPFWSRGVLPFAWGRLLTTITIPLSLLGSVALFLAWGELLSRDGPLSRRGFFLSRRRGIVLGVAAALFCSVDIAFTLLAAFCGFTTSAAYAAGVLALFSIVVTLFVLRNGLRLIRTIDRSGSGGDSGSTGSGGDSGASSAQARERERGDAGENNNNGGDDYDKEAQQRSTIAPEQLGGDILAGPSAFGLVSPPLGTIQYADDSSYAGSTLELASQDVQLSAHEEYMLDTVVSEGPGNAGSRASGTFASQQYPSQTSTQAVVGRAKQPPPHQLQQQMQQPQQQRQQQRPGSKPKQDVDALAKASRDNRRAAKDRARRLTRAVNYLALTMLVTSLAVLVAGQNFVIFRPVSRAFSGLVVYSLLTVQSFFKFGFFSVPNVTH